MKKSRIIVLVLIISILSISCNQKNKKTDYIKKVVLNEETIAVGIYKAKGIDYKDIQYISEAIKIDAGIVYVTLADSNLYKTRLDNIDVLVLPRMVNVNDIEKIDAEITEIIKSFVAHKGNGIVTIGNGGLLFSNNERIGSLGLIDVKLKSDSGKGLEKGIVEWKLTNEGEKVFPDLLDYDSFYMTYNNEFIAEVQDTNTTEILAKGVFENEEFPIIISAQSGKGKVIMINASPETTPGMRWVVPRIIRWIENKDFVWYDENVFNPAKYNQPLILDESVQLNVQNLLQQLDSDNKDQIMSAMDKLQETFPLAGAEKVRLLLIEKNDDIKLRAAEYLVDIEYTYALKDLEEVIKKERRKKVKAQLIEYKEQLESMLEQN